MATNSSASLYGARGRGAKASVASPEGLRNMLRNETETDSAPAPVAAKAAPVASAAPVAPADDKQTLRGLNDRLSGYLDNVRQLQEKNENLKKEIDDVLAKRKTPEGRDWEKVEEPLEELKQKLKDITLDNARLLVEVDNTAMANGDLNNKLANEKKSREELEKDLDSLKNFTDDMKLKNEQIAAEIDMVKDEVERLKQDHQPEVEYLREKVRDSEVNVEIDSKNNDLSEILKKIRAQYDKIAEKNLKETEEWYHNKFENIKVVEAKNTEALQSGQSELKELLKQKKTVENLIQASNLTIKNLEEVLKNTKVENGHHLGPFNQKIMRLEEELIKIRTQVENMAENNRDLVSVKMKLEAEINSYNTLIEGPFDDSKSSAKPGLKK